jgi:hypothetical protein
MSLDNVLAVAGAAREHPVILIFGLALSIAMMGAAASFIARLLQNHRWIAYVGLAIILYVAVEMIFRGTLDIMRVASDMTLHTAASLPAAVPDIVKRRDFRVKAVILSGSQHVRRDVGRSLTIAKPVPRRSRQRVDRLSLSACHLLACHSRFGRCSVSRVLRRSRSSSIMRAVGEEVGRLL